MNGVREQEADGLLDNLLVRKVSRTSWLGGRVAIIVVLLALIPLGAAIGFWLPAAAQHSGLGFGTLAAAAFNASAPAVLLLGIALCVYGLRPRWTAAAGYSVLAWSFLVQLLGSAIPVNHWVMDTSLLRHIVLAPAVDPDWPVNAGYLGCGLFLGLVGGWLFHRRDLVTM
jgi:ABC-2 type transport system permease protein